MLRSVLVLWALAPAACFDPHPQGGAPCADHNVCPSGLSCIAGVCNVPERAIVDAAVAQDASIDTTPTIDDRDGDGVANAMDNCPEVANADQGNEDGDAFGDACDPCPIDADNSDPDNDGVAGSCDPHPTTAGDRILVFEGFHRMPSGWTVVGTVTQAGDDVALTVVANNHTALAPPIATMTNGMVMAGISVDSTVGQFDAAMTVTMPYEPTNDEGVFCELYAPNAASTGGHYVALWDSPQQKERATRAFAWTLATPYRVALVRTGQSYSCSVTPAGGAAQTATGQTDSAPMPSKAAVAAYGSNAHVAWMLVVSSP